jgi:DNA-binding transcriptional MerR regulator
LATTLYRAGEFARRAGVSVRTLRFYDQKGLLRPADRTGAGHRLYTDEDLVALEQILALKFLGFSLEEIAGYLRAGADDLLEGLARQKALLAERQAQIDTVIRAIERVERLARAGRPRGEGLDEIMEAIRMTKEGDLMDKYFTPEQARAMRDLSERSYSEEAKRKMAEWPEWTAEDQARVDAQYADIAERLRRLVAEGRSPESDEAQEVAKAFSDLIGQFTRGDADIEQGLGQWWQNWEAMPEDQRPPAMPWGPEEGAFLAEAQAIYQRRRGPGG